MTVLRDTWLLDPQSGRWEEVRRELLCSLSYNCDFTQLISSSCSMYFGSGKYFSRMVTTCVFSPYPHRIAIYCVYSIFQRIAAHNLCDSIIFKLRPKLAMCFTLSSLVVSLSQLKFILIVSCFLVHWSTFLLVPSALLISCLSFFPPPIHCCYRSWTGSVLSSVYYLLQQSSGAVQFLCSSFFTLSLLFAVPSFLPT